MNSRPDPWALVLSDGKPGHQNQSLGVIPKGLEANLLPVTYPSKSARYRVWLAARFPALAGGLIGQFPWAGAIDNPASLEALVAKPPVVVVSSGSGPAPVNLLLARHLGLPAVTCMTPSVGLTRFDLALVPQHDRPPNAPNIMTTLGAPNRVDPTAQIQVAAAFRHEYRLDKEGYMALLVGGESAHHTVPPPLGELLLRSSAELAQKLGLGLVVTTSRRTSAATESAMVAAAENRPVDYFCKGRTDPAQVVPGMLALSRLTVVTEDSVSMVSEAASAPGGVLVVRLPQRGKGTPRRHEAVVSALADEGYIRRTSGEDLIVAGAELMEDPPPPTLEDSARCQQAVTQLLERWS